MQPMKFEWDQIIHIYLPVTISVSAQLAFLLLPINLRTWRTDLLNAWTYSGIQVFVAGLLFIIIPGVFGIFQLSYSAMLTTLIAVFVASWWKVVRNIPLEATFPVTPEFVEQPVVSFDSFYNPERLRQLSELSGEGSYTLQRQKALREMLVRRRVDSSGPDSDDD
ncbi:MAG: hypothetical protein RLZZ488_2770 [Pseudomonadota bacterium]